MLLQGFSYEKVGKKADFFRIRIKFIPFLIGYRGKWGIERQVVHLFAENNRAEICDAEK